MAAFFADRNLMEKRTVREQQETFIFEIQKENVVAFTMNNAEGAIRLEKQNGEWRITSPRSLPADESQVDSLLTNLGVATRKNRIETDDFGQYGLDDPSVSVTLESSEGKSQALLVGTESTVPGRWFGRLKGQEEVFTVASHIRNFLDKSLYYLRSKDVFKVEPGEITSIEVTTSDVSWTILKDDEGEWVLNYRGTHETDPDEVQNLFTTVGNLKMVSFVERLDDSTTPGSFGLATPRISLVINENEDDILEIGNQLVPEKRYFARKKGSEEIFTIQPGVVDLLSNQPAQFRKKEFLPWPSNESTGIKVIAGNSYISLVKDDESEWEIEGKPEVEIKQERIQRFILTLQSLEIKSIEEQDPASLEPYGLERPRLRVILYNDNLTDDGRFVLSIGDKAEGREICYARTGENEILGIDWTIVGKLYFTEDDIMDRTLIKGDHSEVKKIVYSREDYPDLIFESKDSGWSMKRGEEASGETVSKQALDALLQILFSLEFERNITGMDSEQVSQLMEPVTGAITIYDEDENETVSLTIGSLETAATVIKTGNNEYFTVESGVLKSIISGMEALAKTKR